jgi:hypothetical protein
MWRRPDAVPSVASGRGIQETLAKLGDAQPIHASQTPRLPMIRPSKNSADFARGQDTRAARRRSQKDAPV